MQPFTEFQPVGPLVNDDLTRNEANFRASVARCYRHYRKVGNSPKISLNTARRRFELAAMTEADWKRDPAACARLGASIDTRGD